MGRGCREAEWQELGGPNGLLAGTSGPVARCWTAHVRTVPDSAVVPGSVGRAVNRRAPSRRRRSSDRRPVEDSCDRVESATGPGGGLRWPRSASATTGVQVCPLVIASAQALASALGTALPETAPHLTMSAVTIPNMPSKPSACWRMWQWNAHAPGSSHSMTTSQRSPGLTPRVSQVNAAEPSG
jgi:hypothetical protein